MNIKIKKYYFNNIIKHDIMINDHFKNYFNKKIIFYLTKFKNNNYLKLKYFFKEKYENYENNKICYLKIFKLLTNNKNIEKIIYGKKIITFIYKNIKEYKNNILFIKNIFKLYRFFKIFNFKYKKSNSSIFDKIYYFMIDDKEISDKKGILNIYSFLLSLNFKKNYFLFYVSYGYDGKSCLIFKIESFCENFLQLIKI